jgi:hypothetical protein
MSGRILLAVGMFMVLAAAPAEAQSRGAVYATATIMKAVRAEAPVSREEAIRGQQTKASAIDSQSRAAVSSHARSGQAAPVRVICPDSLCGTKETGPKSGVSAEPGSPSSESSIRYVRVVLPDFS